MKRISSLILPAAILLTDFSCSKKSNTPAAQPVCQIISYVETLTGANPIVSQVSIAYNSKGRAALIQTDRAGTRYNKIYTYNGDTVVITTVGSSNVDTTIFNDQGRVVSFRSLLGLGYTRTDYAYNGDGTVAARTVNNGGGSTYTYMYRYAGGDLMAVTIGADTLEAYTYDTKQLSVQGDYWQHSQLLQYGGGVCVKTTHLVTSFWSNVLQNFTYSFDGGGSSAGGIEKITEMDTEVLGTVVDKMSYGYYCQ